MVYLHANFEVGKFYMITDTGYCEVIKYVEHFGMASLCTLKHKFLHYLLTI